MTRPKYYSSFHRSQGQPEGMIRGAPWKIPGKSVVNCRAETEMTLTDHSLSMEESHYKYGSKNTA